MRAERVTENTALAHARYYKGEHSAGCGPVALGTGALQTTCLLEGAKPQLPWGVAAANPAKHPDGPLDAKTNENGLLL